MKRVILKSGGIYDFEPLGKGGAFYENADSFLDAIDNNVHLPGQNGNASKYLAKPIVHKESRTIDWMINFESLNPNDQYEIVPWAQASAEEKKKANEELKAFTQALNQYGRSMNRRQDQNSSSALLASYLLGDKEAQELPAIHFPNQDCVFIVDGIPVITFWGFSNEPDVPAGSPLAMLKTAPVFSPPLNSNFESPVQQPPQPPQQPPYIEPAPNNEPQEPRKKHACFLPSWLLWLLLLLLLIPLLLWLLWKFFGLFASLFGAPELPSANVNPPAIEAPAENPPQEPQDPVVEAPAEPSAPSDPMNLDIPLPDVTLPNVNLEGGSISGGNLSMTPGAGTGGDAAMGGAGESVAAGAAAPGEQGAAPAQDGAPAGAQDGAQAGTGAGTPAPEPGASDQGVPPVANASDQGVAPAEQGAGAPTADASAAAPAPAPAPATAGSNGQNAPVIPPDIMANNNLSQAQKEAIAAARAAEQQAGIDAARAAENQGGAAGGAVPPELPALGMSKTNGSVASQGVKLFDGDWQTKSPLMDSANGRPLQMSYNFKDGKGQVTVTRPDGSKCVSPSSAAVVNNGIEITNSGRAVCPDKSTYQLPKVRCTDQGNGMVKCDGQVGSQTFPITFHQN